MSIYSRLLMQSAMLALATSLSVNAAAAAQSAPIVQPGAPGEDVREISAEEAVQIAANRFSADDVRFMQDMILHHYQAVELADLVADRTRTEEIVAVAGRINTSQADEIAFMQDWLTERGKAKEQASKARKERKRAIIAELNEKRVCEGLPPIDENDIRSIKPHRLLDRW